MIKANILLAAFLLGLPSDASAQCVSFDKPSDAFEISDAVFLGTVVANGPTGNTGEHTTVDIATLRVERVWKGDPGKEVPVGADLVFQIGRQYVVFAAGKPLSTTLECKMSQLVEDAKPKLDWLARRRSRPASPTRSAVIAAAADIILKAHYCTFVTIDGDGQPQARIVDPLAPDASFTIWVATNPLTRKVSQIRRNPRVTLSCFDAASSSYVTLLGRAALVTDIAEKERHWKDDWSRIYPNGAAGSDVVLIRITPARLEIVSESRGMVGDPKTWLPLAIDFPR